MRRSIHIRIRAPGRLPLFASLGLCALVLAVLGMAVWEASGVQASGRSTPSQYPLPRRRFYLSKDTAQGSDAKDICGPGFHFASLWEILDPSGLEYDKDLGFTSIDSGDGVPTTGDGWIRTGYSSSTTGGPGQVNCTVWTDSSASSIGSVATIHPDWMNPGVHDVHIWNLYTLSCNQSLRVWCVQDHVGHLQFLPLVMKD